LVANALALGDHACPRGAKTIQPVRDVVVRFGIKPNEDVGLVLRWRAHVNHMQFYKAAVQHALAVGSIPHGLAAKRSSHHPTSL